MIGYDICIYSHSLKIEKAKFAPYFRGIHVCFRQPFDSLIGFKNSVTRPTMFTIVHHSGGRKNYESHPPRFIHFTDPPFFTKHHGFLLEREFHHIPLGPCNGSVFLIWLVVTGCHQFYIFPELIIPID